MRAAIALLLLSMIALGGCGMGLLGNLGDLGALACSGYDLDGDGITTAEEVASGFEALTGVTPSDAEVQEFLDTYCSSL